MAFVLFHNPRCSKSRQVLKLLQEQGQSPDIHEYLKQPPTPKELRAILDKLGMPANALIRSKDKKIKELNLGPFDKMSEDELVQLMSEHPQLIQRPILIHGNRARLGRPPEAVLEIVQ